MASFEVIFIGMSKYILLINGSVYGDSSGYHALQFAQAVLKAGHQIVSVFFYQNGVTQANCLVNLPGDELNLQQEWQLFAKQHTIDLIICASASLRRGIISEQEAKQYQLAHWNLGSSFIMGGLTELVSGIETSDHLLCF